MADLRDKVDELAALMDEFRLSEASLHGEGWQIGFKRGRVKSVSTGAGSESETAISYAEAAPVPAAPEVPKGTPVSSPMNGIFYTSPSPSAPAFVQEGDTVTAGQVVGLIEAMKVFNEITAPVSGTVTKVLAETGQLVAPGEPLLYIG